MQKHVTIMNDSFKQLFLGLYKMVIAENSTNHFAELQVLYELGRDAGISNDEINDAIINGSGVELYTPTTLDEKVRFLYSLSLIAWANDNIAPQERELLKETARRFDFMEENLNGIVDYLLDKAKNKVSVEDIITEINNS